MNCECCGRNTFALGSLGPYCFECALTTIFEHRDRGRRNMSDKIKVGDRVLNPGFGERTVVAVDGNSAWIRDKDGWQCVAKLSNLTRIVPEPVTLTAKYAVGQRLLSRKGNFVVVKAISLTTRYEFEGWKGFWPEENYKPVPAPCPTCKGSGKASE